MVPSPIEHPSASRATASSPSPVDTTAGGQANPFDQPVQAGLPSAPLVSSSRDRCIARLRALAVRSPASRLPPLRRLARELGVSTRTLRAAVAALQQSGELATRPGSGTWPAGAMIASSRKPSSDRLLVVDLAADLRREIGEGRWPSGEALPAPKILAATRGMHPATMRRILGILVGEGVLERAGRSWMVPRPRPKGHRHGAQLLCVGAADPDGGLRIDTDREWDFWREIQAESVRCGLEPQITPWRGSLPRGAASCLGAVVSTWHVGDPGEILAPLAAARLPAAIWIENANALPGPRWSRHRTLRFHDLAYARDAGFAMGGHLAALGHRRVAWISPFHGSRWSRNRLDGLREGLGDDAEVVPFVLDEAVSEWDFQLPLWSDPAIWSRIDLSDLDLRDRPAEVVRPFIEAHARERILAAFAPCLEAATESGCTAFAAASDAVAALCLHWLEPRGVRVPQDLSLCGFDDTRFALRRDLTSLRFDAAAMARAMVRQVLAPGQAPAVTRYAGAVVARGSTRRPPT